MIVKTEVYIWTQHFLSFVRKLESQSEQVLLVDWNKY